MCFHFHSLLFCVHLTSNNNKKIHFSSPIKPSEQQRCRRVKTLPLNGKFPLVEILLVSAELWINELSFMIRRQLSLLLLLSIVARRFLLSSSFRFTHSGRCEFLRNISSLSFPLHKVYRSVPWDFTQTKWQQNSTLENWNGCWGRFQETEKNFNLFFVIFFFFFSASALFMSKWGSSLSAAAEANELFSAVLRVSQHWQVFVVRHHHHRRLRRRRHSQTVESKYFYFKTRHFSGVESNENLRVKWRQ